VFRLEANDWVFNYTAAMHKTLVMRAQVGNRGACRRLLYMVLCSVQARMYVMLDNPNWGASISGFAIR
jgi:hypothetical protein